MALKLSPAQRHALGLSDDATDDDIKTALRKLGLKLSEEDDGDGTQVTPGTQPGDPAQVQQPSQNPPAAPAGGFTAPVGTQQSPTPTPAPTGPAPTGQAPQGQPQGQTPPAPQGQQGQAPQVQGQPEVTPQAVAASAGQLGLRVVDANMFSRLEQDAAAGRLARDQQDKERRDRLCREALNRGKFHVDSLAQFRAMADNDEGGLIKLFAAMPDGVMPVQPAGHAQAPELVNASQGGGGDAVRAAEAKRAGLYSFFNVPAPEASKG